MAEGPRLTAADLELAPAGDRAEGKGLRQMRQTMERETIRRTLAKHRGNVSQTAAELGISRPTLYGLMEKLGIGRE